MRNNVNKKSGDKDGSKQQHAGSIDDKDLGEDAGNKNSLEQEKICISDEQDSIIEECSEELRKSSSLDQNIEKRGRLRDRRPLLEINDNLN